MYTTQHIIIDIISINFIGGRVEEKGFADVYLKMHDDASTRIISGDFRNAMCIYLIINMLTSNTQTTETELLTSIYGHS